MIIAKFSAIRCIPNNFQFSFLIRYIITLLTKRISSITKAIRSTIFSFNRLILKTTVIAIPVIVIIAQYISAIP